MTPSQRRPLRLAPLPLLLLVSLALGGCSRDKVHIESETSWEGAINDQIQIVGYGNKTFEIHGKLGCVVVRKNLPDTLLLRLRINDRPGVETRAPLGVLQQCK